jgi:hypothetical protein
MKKFLLIIGLGVNLCAQSQSFQESFDDGDFLTPPYTWTSPTGGWTVIGTATAGPNTSVSNSLRLAAPAAGTYSISTPNSNWGSTQGWGFWMGRNTPVNAGNNQYFWLYSDQQDVTSATRNGYRIALAATGGPDEIRLERVNGTTVTTIITSTQGIPAGLADYAFLVRVTRSSSDVWNLYTGVDLTALIPGGGDFPFAIPFFVNEFQGSGVDAAPIAIPATGLGYLGVQATCAAGAAARASAEFDNILFDANGTLPVTLEAFKATRDGSKSKLDWKVGTEDNVKGYEIERSVNGVNFSRIGFVPATGASSYSFTDGNILSGVNFYRLKTVDLDGKYAYSFIISINNRAGSFVKVFPNPASDRVYVQHTQAGSGAQIKVINMDGRLMQSTRIAENTAQTILDIQKLPAGIYNLIYDYGNGEQMVSKFVKQ